MLLKKVYQVSKKGKEETPRLFLQHLVCEAAGFIPGNKLKISLEEQKIIIEETNCINQHNISVSSRVNRTTGLRRPLVDTAKESYKEIIRVNEKVEVCVYHKKIVVQPLHFQLTDMATIPKSNDERISLLSVCAGGGIGTASFADTQYFTPVAEIELEEDCCEAIRHNFSSLIMNCDVRDINVVPKVDVINITAPCVKYSPLGDMEEATQIDLAIAVARIIRAAEPEMIFFENVPAFFKSRMYSDLKELIVDELPYWSEKNIEAYDYGSIARRNRTYALAFRTKEAFLDFQFPSPPRTIKRPKLKVFLDSKDTDHDWKDFNSWKKSFESRDAFKNRSLEKSFVTPDSKEIQCILSRYRSHCASNTYLLNEDKTKWRFFSEAELCRILSIPKWFTLPDTIPMTRRYEIIGQSVDCRVIKAIANQIAKTFYKLKTVFKKGVNKVKEAFNETFPISMSENGQLSLGL
ncbi:DNA cytosine methyltransferase [Bacillus paranthracis]|uniref:DNA cytosine methyltransferase n=1 Tax=Bacillus cereus group TaxID=86661 RepID=UPI0014449318|nr:DNA cytosine methyltransferase [Bacillus paranthracis]NKX27241.1 DNA cytosine methyltransferase [Bacillus paranthracis]